MCLAPWSRTVHRFYPRMSFLAARGAACKLQNFVRARMQHHRYKRMRASVAKIKAQWHRYKCVLSVLVSPAVAATA